MTPGWKLTPGSVIKVSWPGLGIPETRCRVMEDHENDRTLNDAWHEMPCPTDDEMEAAGETEVTIVGSRQFFAKYGDLTIIDNAVLDVDREELEKAGCDPFNLACDNDRDGVDAVELWEDVVDAILAKLAEGGLREVEELVRGARGILDEDGAASRFYVEQDSEEETTRDVAVLKPLPQAKEVE